MFVNSKKIISIIEKFAPICDAEEWDNVGFQIGNINTEVDKVMVTLDIDLNVVDEAIEKNVDLIISHHPLIFNKISKIDDSMYIGKVILKLIKNNISVYVAHTNLDASMQGPSDYLAELLGLENVSILVPISKNSGFARVGTLKESMKTSEFIEYVKEKLNLNIIKFVGEAVGNIYKVGLCTGAGSEYYIDAKKNSCDIYITSDVKYHIANDMINDKLKVMDLGHFETENIYMERLKKILEIEFEHKGYDVKVILSSSRKSPFNYF